MPEFLFMLLLLAAIAVIPVMAGILADKTARPRGDRKTGFVLVGTAALSLALFIVAALLCGIEMGADTGSSAMFFMMGGGYAVLTAAIAAGMYSHRYKATIKQQS